MSEDVKKAVKGGDGLHHCPECGKNTSAGENKEPLRYYVECEECGCRYETTSVEFSKSNLREDLPGTVTTYYGVVGKAEKIEHFKDHFDYIDEINKEIGWTFNPHSFKGKLLRILSMTFNPSIIEELLWYMGKDPSRSVTVKIYFKSEDENFPCIFEGEDNYYLVSPFKEVDSDEG